MSNKSESISGLNNGEICKINRLTNEDKDLETLLSELKTTFIQKSKENNNEEDIFNKNNNNFYLFKNDDFNSQKRIDSDIIDFTNLHLDLDEPGYEINQRVHSKKAKTHNKIKTGGNKINNVKKIAHSLFVLMTNSNFASGFDMVYAGFTTHFFGSELIIFSDFINDLFTGNWADFGSFRNINGAVFNEF